ncbi:MAG: glutamate-1-semialdehyde 2,1-aminomutase [Bdellovibrionales bacterium]|nr:glutamate-1-semialdehyde 2,1-aminomutase [Bdellovibrionales bacterium]
MAEAITSKSLYERALKISPGGVHSPVRASKSVGGEPVFFRFAEGAYLESVEGRRYVDFCQSFGPNILGHRDPDVSREVEKILSRAWTLGACEPYSLELAEWMVSRIPWLEQVRFVCSGTEAVMSALRVARAATGRSKILKFDGCYHGHVDSMLVKAGSGLAGEVASDSAGVPQEIASTTLIAPLDNEDAVEKVFARSGREIAAVILEPLPANFGLLIQREEFIRRVVELARQHGALVIFDEVISGFRVGIGGMAERLGIRPDLVTYGKVIGGGFPVGCYGGRQDLMNLVAPAGPVYQAGTLSANPVGMVAGLATLKKMEQGQILGKLNDQTSQFCQKLNQHFERLDRPWAVSEYASLFWFHPRTDQPLRSVKDFVTGQADLYRKFFHACLERGVYLAPSAFEVAFVSSAHFGAALDKAEEVFVEAVTEMYER